METPAKWGGGRRGTRKDRCGERKTELKKALISTTKNLGGERKKLEKPKIILGRPPGNRGDL